MSWVKPPRGWVKVNTDGSASNPPGRAGAGGLLRDEEGDGGFSLNVGSANSLSAELFGIREGLNLAWEKGFRKVVIESDSEAAISLVKMGDVKSHPLGGLIQDCKVLIGRFWDCQISHTFREGNTSADFLAGLGSAQSERCIYWVNPPQELCPIVFADMVGTSFLRVVAA